MLITQGFLSNNLISEGFIPSVELTSCQEAVLCKIGTENQCVQMLYIKNAYLPAITCCQQRISVKREYII